MFINECFDVRGLRIGFILPVKPFALGKSRFAAVVGDGLRRELNRLLFEHVAHELRRSCGSTGHVFVVSRDGQVREQAREMGFVAIAEPDECDNLSGVVKHGALCAKELGVDWVCYLPVDLPLLDGAELATELVAAHESGKAVVVPGGAASTTSVLSMNSADKIEYSFGEGGFDRHVALLLASGRSFIVLRSGNLETDIDQAADICGVVTALKAKAGKLSAAQREMLRVLAI